MMKPAEFLKTIYLGDRGLKSILVDGWRDRVVLQINLISRVRSASGNWEYYAAEDIIDGLIVFTGVISFEMSPPGLIPNDAIHAISVEELLATDRPQGNEHIYRFKVLAESANEKADHFDVYITLVATGIHIEDPSAPDIIIDN